MAFDELKKLLRSPRITFEKGQEYTANDQHLGFVSKLENMEVVNGAVQNRKGSKVLNDTSEQESFLILKGVEVSGSEFLLGVNTKREVKAWFPRAVQKTMQVMRQAFTPFMDTTTISERNYKFQFARGDRFFIESGLKYIMIFNNYGDIFRINKRGHIQYLELNTTPEDWTPTEASTKNYKITSARRYDNEGIGLFLDIEEMTHKEIQSFNIYEDLSGNTVPIRGDIRIAHINEAGEIGKFSEPLGSRNWQSVIISRIPMLAGRPVRANLSVFLFGGGLSVEEDDDAETYYELGAKRTGVVYEEGDETKSYITLNPIQLPTAGISFRNRFNCYTLSESLYENGTTEWKDVYLFREDGFLKFFLRNSTDDLIDVTSEASSGFIKLKDIKWYDLKGENLTVDSSHNIEDEWVKQKADTLDTCVDFYKVYDASSDFLPAGIDTVTYNSTSDVYTITADTDNRANRVLFACSKARGIGLEEAPFGTLTFTNTGGTSSFTVNGSPFGVAKVLVDTTNSVLATTSFEYDSEEIPSNPLLVEDKGYDCWKMREKDFGSDKIQYVNLLTGQVITTAILEGDYPAGYVDRDVMKEYLDTGERFAVWNDGYIIAESQEFFHDIDLDYPTYTTDDTPTSNYRYATKPKKYFKKSNNPICALDFQSIRRYAVDINFMEEHITDPQAVVISSGNLFVVQGNRLWLGNSNRMILDRVIDFDSPVNFIEKAGRGVLVFSENGISEVKSTGTISGVDTSQITDTTAKATYSGKGGVYAVMGDESVVRIILVTAGVQVPFYRAIPMAIQLSDKTWGDAPILQYAGNTLYIAHDSEIWGLQNGIWSKRFNFEGFNINALAELQGELVVSFDDKEDMMLKYDNDLPDMRYS